MRSVTKSSADKVQILGPVCPRLFPASLYVVSGHMAAIWAGPGDVRTLQLADILGPAGHFYSFSRGGGKRGAGRASNLGLAT